MNDPFVFTFPVWIIAHDIAENTGFLGGMVLGTVKGENAAAVFTDEDQARRLWESELAGLPGSNDNKFTLRALDPLAFLGLLTLLPEKGIAYLLSKNMVRREGSASARLKWRRPSLGSPQAS